MEGGEPRPHIFQMVESGTLLGFPDGVSMETKVGSLPLPLLSLLSLLEPSSVSPFFFFSLYSLTLLSFLSFISSSTSGTDVLSRLHWACRNLCHPESMWSDEARGWISFPGQGLQNWSTLTKRSTRDDSCYGPQNSCPEANFKITKVF